VGATLRNALAGNDDARLYEDGTEYPIRIRLDDISSAAMPGPGAVPLVINGAGMPVRLAQFATVERHEPPSLVERMDRMSAVTLTADALGRGSGSVADDVVAYLAKNPAACGGAHDLGQRREAAERQLRRTWAGRCSSPSSSSTW
jgi:HAE1 family hydrophobic/amphiphilic exporter-1